MTDDPETLSANPLAGKKLRYYIGTSDTPLVHPNEIVEVAYDVDVPPLVGIPIKYGNLFDEEYDENSGGDYGPYLHDSDTAQEYHEGQIDPRGKGWGKNLREQFERARRQGFKYIELDNPDAYHINDVVGAVDLAATYGLKVIAKNPLLIEGDPLPYVAHPAVMGVIVEKGAGYPTSMDKLRFRANKPDLPVWFVSFGSGRPWAQRVAALAKGMPNMYVTYSRRGEYRSSEDIVS